MVVATRLGLFVIVCSLGCAEVGTRQSEYTDPVGAGGSDASDGEGDDAGAAGNDGGDGTGSGHAPQRDSGTPSVPGRDAGLGSGVDASAGDAGKDPGATPPQACSKPATLMPGAQMTVMLNGRQYLLHVGKGVKPGVAAPLVFSLHGLNMTPNSMESMARWFPLSDSKGFIVAGPAGVGGSNGWDLSGTKDFDLMKAVIDDIDSKICVDRKRIYSTGFSHGGFMSNANGCRLSDVFAAIAPHSGAAGGACAAKRPMPVFAFHGDADSIVSYNSGKSSVDGWVARNKCSGTPTTFTLDNAKCQEWSSCEGGSEVKFCTIPRGNHIWFRPATAAIWEFFTEHTLP